MIVYKGYSQEALDAQYNNRALVPDHRRIMEAWAERSRELDRRVSPVFDLAYGTGVRERLDIFPAERAGAPVLVFFHGGYWQALSKEWFHFLAEGFLDRHVTVALVGYPLAPEATLSDIAGSCGQALAWLYRRAAAYGGDPRRLHLCGHSAGGQLVGMLMATDWKAVDPALPKDLIRGGCAVSGLFDLRPIRLSYLNAVLGLDEASAQRNSPALLTPPHRAPLIVSVGEKESEEYHAQSRALAERWSEQGLLITPLTLAGHDHFTVVGEISRRGSALHCALLEQMGLDEVPPQFCPSSFS